MNLKEAKEILNESGFINVKGDVDLDHFKVINIETIGA